MSKNNKGPFTPRRAIMIDIEAKDRVETAEVLQISAIIFDTLGGPGEMVDENKNIICPHIDLLIDHSPGSQPGRTIGKDTMEWWDEQPYRVRKHVFEGGPRVTLASALDTLETFMKAHEVDAIICHPPTYDANIIRNAFMTALGRELYMPFFHQIDCKTLEGFIFGRNTRKEGEIHAFGDKHNALHDVIAQAIMTQACYRWRMSMSGPGVPQTRGDVAV